MQEAEYLHAFETLKPPGAGGYISSEYDVGVRWRLLSGDLHGVMQGVDVIALHGHAPGSQGLVVRLQQTGTVVLASDAAYTLDSLGPPPVPGATVHDYKKWVRSVERLRAYRSAEKALIVAGHDMQQLPGLLFAPEKYYE